MVRQLRSEHSFTYEDDDCSIDCILEYVWEKGDPGDWWTPPTADTIEPLELRITRINDTHIKDEDEFIINNAGTYKRAWDVCWDYVERNIYPGDILYDNICEDLSAQFDRG
ncbi:MAG: hypothetical protein AMXMBFR16_11220 [Candidatus Uhrbacteria bacterium]